LVRQAGGGGVEARFMQLVGMIHEQIMWVGGWVLLPSACLGVIFMYRICWLQLRFRDLLPREIS